MSKKDALLLPKQRTIGLVLFCLVIVQGCAAKTSYVPPAFDRSVVFKNIVICVEGEPQFEVYDKRFEFHWYDLFIPYGIGRLARDEKVKQNVNPNQLFSPQEIFSTELIHTIKNSHRFKKVHLAAQSKDIPRQSDFDALLVLNVKEWGMVGTQQEKDTLIPYLLLDLRMTRLADGRILWKEQFRLRSKQRDYIDNYAANNGLFRKDLVAMADRTGNRIAALLGGAKTTLTPEAITQYAALVPTASLHSSNLKASKTKIAQKVPNKSQNDLHFSRIPDGKLLPDDIQRLFADKTVRGHQNKKDVNYYYYFGTDGSLQRKMEEKMRVRTGRWTTNAQGMCISYDNSKKKCYELIKENGVINQYTTKHAGKRKIKISFTEFYKGKINSLLVDERKDKRKKKHRAP